MSQTRRIDIIERLSSSSEKRKRKAFLIPLILIITSTAFIFQLYLYKSLKLNEIELSIFNVPHQKWNPDRHHRPLPKIQNINESSWQDSNLFDVKNFTWIRNNESLCKLHSHSTESSQINLLPVLIFTSRQNFHERLSIRESWGSIPLYRNWDVRLIFLLGQADPRLHTKSEIEQQEKKITEEENKFGDIVLGSFIDSYRNLTYKHLMGYKWILNFCPEATHIMKSDDDLFVDIMKWLDWVTNDTIKRNGSKTPDIYCNVIFGGPPTRKNGEKWAVTKEEWPGATYPTYCSGWTYVIKITLLQKLYSVSNNLKFFWVDDIFITGALMEEAKRKYAKTPMEWQPEIIDISYTGKFTIDFRKFMRMCDKEDWDQKRNFGCVVYLSRDNKYSSSWRMCLWNKTVHDYHKLLNKSKNKSKLTMTAYIKDF